MTLYTPTNIHTYPRNFITVEKIIERNIDEDLSMK
jgi:hypothetical protein